MKPERAVQDLRRDMRAEAARTRSRSGGEVHVVVITSDFSLLSVLQQAGSPEHSFWQTSSADAAVDLLVSGRRGILILDLATLSGNLTNLLYRLELQFPELVVLATGTREQESSVVTLVGKGRIYRFLHKPVSPARAGLFLGTATRRFLEMRSGEARPLAAVKELASRRPTKAIVWSALGVLAVVGGGAAVMVAMQRTSTKPAVARTAPEPARSKPAVEAQPVRTAPAAAPAQNVDTAGMLSRYLSVAQGAFSAGRLVSPPGDNALEYYQSALRLQENNAEALLGIDRITITLETRVTQALRDSDAAAAAQALDVFQQAQPNAPQLASLRTRVLALSAPQPAAAPRRPSPTPAANSTPPTSSLARAATPPKPSSLASSAVVTVNIDQARARIRNGQLIEPADNSALFFLRRAQDSGEDSSRLRIAATDLGQRLLDGARSAWAANQNGQAQRLLDAANLLDRQFNLDLPDLDGVVAEGKRVASAGIEQARTQRLAAAVQAREAGQLLEPSGDSAYDRLMALLAEYPSANDVLAERQRLTAALVANGDAALKSGNRQRAQSFSERASNLLPNLPEVVAFSQQVTAALRQPTVVSGNSLPRVREVAPRYPRAAERDGIEGTVDVEFTIAEDGTTRDLVVRDSNPKQIFDNAAVDAVSKWVFKPVLRDGLPIEQRTVIKIRFALKR